MARNSVWHDAHPISQNPTTDDRILWHREHKLQCACRPVPKDVEAFVSSDLPYVGRPAMRALQALGITTLKQVASYSEKELLTIHGIGPKAVAILQKEFAKKDLAFKK